MVIFLKNAEQPANFLHSFVLYVQLFKNVKHLRGKLSSLQLQSAFEELYRERHFQGLTHVYANLKLCIFSSDGCSPCLVGGLEEKQLSPSEKK